MFLCALEETFINGTGSRGISMHQYNSTLPKCNFEAIPSSNPSPGYIIL
jgi:hypothetical protein